MRKLNTTVHAVEVDEKGQQTGQQGVFGPDDDLPGWARKAITNPDVWEGSDDEPPAGGEDKPAGARGRRSARPDDSQQ
jgi:hypothetical protein